MYYFYNFIKMTLGLSVFGVIVSALGITCIMASDEGVEYWSTHFDLFCAIAVVCAIMICVSFLLKKLIRWIYNYDSFEKIDGEYIVNIDELEEFEEFEKNHKN